MPRPIGPSLQIAFALADAFAGVSLAVLRAGLERCLASQRHSRKLDQLVQLGWISPPDPTRGVEQLVRLTESGRLAALGGRDPEQCWRRPWDGRWRLVLFDVPETRRALRARLQRKLRRLGFGYLQNSVWITPDSVRTLKDAVQTNALNVEALSFMEARPCGGESDEDLVHGAWEFAAINRNYDHYLEMLGACPPPLAGPLAKQRWLEAEWKAWHRAVRDDPLLPEALLPAGYRGKIAWTRRQEKLHRLVRSVR
jgi:phenylacetic acid degradation operon negative regulatory protein